MSESLEFPCRLHIAGGWVNAASGRTLSILNPADHGEVASVPCGGADEASAAVAAATQALPGWRATPAPARGDCLRRLHDLLIAHREPLASLLTLEQGKPLPQARAEVDYAASFYLWYAEEARRICGFTIPHREAGKTAMVEYQPVGVIAAITPWNFPLAMGAKKIAAALAAGCTAVWKPSEETPLMALATAWLAARAGLPAGVLNVVFGDAAAIGERWMEEAAVLALSFTGSTRTGLLLLRQAAATLKRVQLELGGNAPFIVLEDADLDLASEDFMKLKFLVSGQVCVTANRLLVQRRIEEEFTHRLTERLRALRIGPGLEEGVEVGPLINEAGVKKVESLVEDACRSGARLLYSADLPPALDRSCFYPPTLLAGVNQNQRIAREEIFGPVVAMQAFASEEEALTRANDTEYGLAAYVYSRDVERATELARRIEAGIVGVNDPRPLRAEVPFGGIKMSGFGREGGREGLMEFLECRVIGVRRAPRAK